MSNLKIQVILDLVEKVTAPLKRVMNESGKAGQSLKKLRDQLKQLEDKQKTIASFRQLHQELHHTGERLSLAQDKVKTLANEIAATENPTRTLTREFERAKRAAQLISEQNQRQSIELQRLRDRLSNAGISTRSLVSQERELRNSMAQTNREITTQQQRLAELTRRHEMAAAASRRLESSRSRAGHAASNGMGMMLAGGGMLSPVALSINEAAEFQQQVSRFRALGVGEDMVKEGVKFAKGMDIMGSSVRDNMKILTEAHSITRDFHHAQEISPMLAKMKFGIENVMKSKGHGEGHGEEAERMLMDLIKVGELRGALKDMNQFKRVLDFATQAYVASGGLVKPEELLHMIQTGGVAAKQLSDESFFFGFLHTIQEKGGFQTGTGLMTAYQNWAAGRTTQQSAEELVKLGLIKKNAIKYDTTGRVKKLMPDAQISAEKYASDPFKYLMEDVLPKIEKPGMTQQQVISKINTLFSGRKGADLFVGMYLEKEAMKKHREAAKGAYGVDPLYKEGGGLVRGQESEALTKLRNVQLELGTSVLPLYADALEEVTKVLKSVGEFLKEHPKFTKFLVTTFTVLAAVILVMGTLTLAIASVIGPFAMLRYGMTMLGLRAASTTARLGLFSRMVNGLKNAVQNKGKALQWLGSIWSRMSGWAGRALTWLRSLGAYIPRLLIWIRNIGMAIRVAMATNPIGAIITAVIAAGMAYYWLYNHWAPARKFFNGMWADIKGSFTGGTRGLIKGLINLNVFGFLYRIFSAALNYFGVKMPERFSTFGKMLFNGLINGIKSMGSAVKDAIFGMGEKVTTWFKQKLGINSPSRVFTGFGANISEGLSNGIQAAQNLPLNQVNSLSKRLTKAGAGLALTASLNPAFAMPEANFAKAGNRMRFDDRPPLAQASKAAVPRQGDSITINITPAPGADPQAIAKAVAEELDKRERQKDRAKRSALHDYDAY